MNWITIGQAALAIADSVEPFRSVSGPVELTAALSAAKPGTWLQYHTGMLMMDRQVSKDESEEVVARAHIIGKTADAALSAYERGQALLIQRRVGDFAFEYFAVKCEKEE